MTDCELLKLAAKAAAVETWAMEKYPLGAWGWNPLRDDGDALRLAVKLGLEIKQSPDRAIVFYNRPWRSEEPHGRDRLAATRRAIVRAAAKIGSRT